MRFLGKAWRASFSVSVARRIALASLAAAVVAGLAVFLSEGCVGQIGTGNSVSAGQGGGSGGELLSGGGGNAGAGGTGAGGAGGSVGGTTGTGGTTGAGGVIGTGGTTGTGGVTGTGGTRGTGGTTGTGGIIGTGGGPGTGGIVGTGGEQGTGGMGGSAGGSGTGGAAGTGGTTGTGGMTGTGGSGAQDGGGTVTTFTALYTTIFGTATCGGTLCHNPGMQKAVDFSTQTNAYNSLKFEIVPGNSASSGLYKLLSNGTMPPNPNPKLTADQIAAVAAWIDAGALNN